MREYADLSSGPMIGVTETFGGAGEPTRFQSVTDVRWLPPTPAKMARALVSIPPGYHQVSSQPTNKRPNTRRSGGPGYPGRPSFAGKYFARNCFPVKQHGVPCVVETWTVPGHGARNPGRPGPGPDRGRRACRWAGRWASRAAGRPRPPVTRPRPRAPGWLLDWTALAGPAVTLALMLWGLTAHPFWGDEADTISAASRSLPQLLRLLGHVNAVHGLYYLLLWPVVRLAGPSEFAVRLPSALAMAAAAAGVTAIGRRLVSRQAGLYAGLVFALLPTVTRQAHDARPYALLTAAAALASYLLIRLAERPTLRLLAGYAGCLVAVGYLQLCGMLLLPAHAIALAALAPAGRARTMRRWLASATAASLAVAPVAIIGWQQRAQIAWIPRPGWHDGTDLVTTLLAGGPRPPRPSGCSAWPAWPAAAGSAGWPPPGCCCRRRCCWRCPSSSRSTTAAT